MKNSPLLIIFLTIFIDLLGFGLVVPVLPIFVKELGASNVTVGLVATVFSLVNFIFTPLFGSISDRIGRRPIIVTSVAVNALAYLVFAQVHSLPMLLFSRFLAGLGSSNIAAAQAYISDISTPENRAKSMGTIGAAFGLGFVFGPVVGGLLKVSYGVAMVGYVAAALCALNFVLAFFLLPESLKNPDKSANLRFIPIREYGKALQKAGLAQMFFYSFFYICAFAMMQNMIALFWKEQYALDERHIGYFFALIGLLSGLVQGVFIGKLVNRFGEKRLLLFGAVGLAIGFLLIAIAPVAYYLPMTLLSITLICLSSGVMSPSLTALISKSTDAHEQGSILGLAQSFGSLGRIMGPLMSGFFYQITPSLPFLMSAVLTTVCIYFALYLLRWNPSAARPTVDDTILDA
jgi:MFS transporter, DHA1 family, tetracycline resistance protein